MSNIPKVVFFDVETSLVVAGTFSLYPERIDHNNIIQDWFMMSAAWKIQGNKTVYSTSINDFKRKKLDDDYGVIKALREALEDADIVVGHNSDKFDIKKLTARLIYHGLPPLPKFLTIDTLKEVKKVAQFTSHRLDYLGKHLIGAGKEHTSHGLWMRALKGDRKAITEMVKYNKVDVIRLEELYDKIRPYMKNPPNFSVLLGQDRLEHACRSCGSLNVKKNGIRQTIAGVQKQEIQCKECCHYSVYPLYKKQ